MADEKAASEATGDVLAATSFSFLDSLSLRSELFVSPGLIRVTSGVGSQDPAVYEFGRSAIDHLRWDFLRLGIVPISMHRWLQLIDRYGYRARIVVRPKDRPSAFALLRKHGWDVKANVR